MRKKRYQILWVSAFLLACNGMYRVEQLLLKEVKHMGFEMVHSLTERKEERRGEERRYTRNVDPEQNSNNSTKG